MSTSLRSRETRIEEESYTLTDLDLETDYTVSVTATNECGVQSSPSQDVTVRIDIQGMYAMLTCWKHVFGFILQLQ